MSTRPDPPARADPVADYHPSRWTPCLPTVRTPDAMIQPPRRDKVEDRAAYDAATRECLRLYVPGRTSPEWEAACAAADGAWARWMGR